ncbi:hypothetical protein [Halalkalibacterium halodurans]|uniref:hypothetical protein n=1 Tax=Halalkalibacterium halodurans TaxID=86665 RepID=UPI002E1BCD5D|nr:hypothetical protein [Halalkalibacterium halodurans]
MKNFYCKSIMIITILSVVFSSFAPSLSIATTSGQDVQDQNVIFEELKKDDDIKDIKYVDQDQIEMYFENGDDLSIKYDDKSGNLTLDSSTLSKQELEEIQNLVNDIVANFHKVIEEEENLDSGNNLMLMSTSSRGCGSYKYLTTIKGSTKANRIAIQAASAALTALISGPYAAAAVAALMEVFKELLPKDQYTKIFIHTRKCKNGTEMDVRYKTHYYKNSNYTGLIRVKQVTETVKIK